MTTKQTFSSLRRLEIRYLPLDPAFVSILFSALNINYVLQELILTDDALAFCGINNFAKLYETLRNNKASALCFIDFSRNVHSIDDNVEINEGMVDALSN